MDLHFILNQTQPTKSTNSRVQFKIDKNIKKKQKQSRAKNANISNSSNLIRNRFFDEDLTHRLHCEVFSNTNCNDDCRREKNTLQVCERRMQLLLETRQKLSVMMDIEDPRIRDVYWNTDAVANTVDTTELPAFASKFHIEHLFYTLS